MPSMISYEYFNSMRTTITSDGGIATKFTNKLGFSCSKGIIVALSPTEANSVVLGTTSNTKSIIGVVGQDGYNMNNEGYITTSGIALIEIEGTVPTYGQKVRVSPNNNGKGIVTTIDDTTSGVIGKITHILTSTKVWILLDIIN